MDITMLVTFIGVNLAMFAALATLVIWAVNRTDQDVKSVGADVKSDVKSICSRLDGHAQRIDQLYKMFVDLLKNK